MKKTIIINDFKYSIDGSDFLFPVFKFLTNKHANLMKNGEVHIPSLHQFRDKSIYKGKILDINEGKIKITNFYDNYQGLAKDANGLLPLMAPPYQHATATNYSISQTFDSPNQLIYCTTRYLFSDSLEWAISEKKETCMLITDFIKFNSKISSKLTNYNFLTTNDCRYTGKDIYEKNPNTESITNELLTNLNYSSYFKDKHYKEQKEVRTIWVPKSNFPVEATTIHDKEISSLLISIDISKIDFTKIKLDNVFLGAKIYKKDNTSPATFILEKKLGICPPVIHRSQKGPWYLGFWYKGEEKTLRDGYFGNASHGITISPIGLIFVSIELSNVKSIEYFHMNKDDYTKAACQAV